MRAERYGKLHTTILLSAQEYHNAETTGKFGLAHTYLVRCVNSFNTDVTL
jgi:hypothetical protein